MERLDKKTLGDPILWLEHSSRYLFAQKLVFGNVYDCACGIGYGSDILSKNDKVKHVTGIDISEIAVEKANELFSGNKKVNYQLGSLEQVVDLEPVDCFVSFETLEHTEKPEECVAAIAKVIKRNGILVGSVPSEFYEDRCVDFYGDNPYHLHKFSSTELRKLLQKKFKYVALFSSEMRVSSYIGDVNREIAYQSISNGENISESEENVDGSFIFVATKDIRVFERTLRACIHTKHFVGPSYFEIDKMLTGEYRRALKATEQLVDERDEYIRNLEAKYDEALAAYKSENKLLLESLEYIKELEKRVKDETTE